MSTYEEFMVILTIGLLIVAILNLKNVKEENQYGIFTDFTLLPGTG